MRLVLLTAALSIGVVTSASAGWFHRVEDDPFTGDLHVAFGVDGSSYNVACRCTNGLDLTLMLITPEKPSPETMALVNSMSPRMAVIIDDNPKLEFAAELETTPDGENIRLSSEAAEVAQVIVDAARAKRRVAIAGMLAGKVVVSHSFSAGGSTNALMPMIKGCKIDPKETKAANETYSPEADKAQSGKAD